MRKLVVCLVLLVMLAACTDVNSSAKKGEIVVPGGTPMNIFEFEHEGMPCIVVEGVYRYGITCDWSKWEGQ